MRRTLLSLAALFLAMGTTMVGSGHIGTFVSLRMSAAEFPSWIIGPVMSGYYLGVVAGAWIAHRIVQRVGHIRAFAVFASTNCAAVLLLPIWINPGFWLVLRIVMGLSGMGLLMVVESWLNERSPRDIRGRVFSIYMVVSFLGLSGGQLLLNIGPILDPIHYYVTGILFSLCVLPVAMTSAVHPQPAESISINWSRIYKSAPFGIVGAFVAGNMNGAFYSLAPIYVGNLGAEVSQIANFMAFSLLGGLLLQYPVGLLSDRFDRRSVLATLTILTALASLTLLLVPAHMFWLLYLNIAIFGGLLFTVYPVAVAHTHDHFESSQVVVVSAALLVFYGLGAVIGPLLAAAMIYPLGQVGLFAFIAAAGLLYGVVAYIRRGFEAVAVHEQDPFVAVASSSPVINSLDPRADEDQVTELENEADI